MSNVARVVAFGALLFAWIGGGTPSFGQSVEWGGRMFVDYFYNVAGPDSAASPGVREGLHGFRYRRLYLTSDFRLSEDFTGRARLAADEGTAGISFVKDLSLTWTYSGDHSATLGITPPPAFGLSEGVWGYRSLEKTIMDFQGIVSSRDFGLRLDGPITGDGTVQYAAMIANNQTIRPEADKYKRIYGQLQFRPSDPLLFVVGADHAGYPDNRESGTRLSAFGGYSTERFRIGIEGYWFRLEFQGGNAVTDVGGGLFSAVQVAPSWELVARVDRTREAPPGPNRYDTLVIGGVSYRPHPNVMLSPNLRVYDVSDGVARTSARVTAEVNF